jgi:hypothetical protein
VEKGGDHERASARERANERAREKAQAERLIRFYEDPEIRKELLAEERASSGASLQGLLTEALVTEEELGHLVGMIAEWQLERSVALARCSLEPMCNRKDSVQDVEVIRGEIASYLGAERYARYRAYRDEAEERGAVDHLRSQLQGSSWMTNAQAQKLVAALADERRSFVAEVKDGGGRVESYGAYAMAARAQRATGKPHLADIESATRFHERMRQRAADHLTPEQLQTFSEMQDASLASLRKQLERRDAAEARRAAAKSAAKNAVTSADRKR